MVNKYNGINNMKKSQLKEIILSEIKLQNSKVIAAAVARDLYKDKFVKIVTQKLVDRIASTLIDF